MLKLVRTFSAIALACLLSPAAAHALTILDDFDEPAGGQVVTLVNPNPGDTTPASVATGLAGVVGSSRELVLTAEDVFEAGKGSEATAEINFVTSPGNFQLKTSIRVDPVVSITWDGDGAGLDQDFSGDVSFILGGVENDLSTTYRMIVSTDGGGTSELTLSPGPGFSGNLTFDFASFAGGASFADIDSIVLEVDGARGADVTIDSLASAPIPEPSTAAALGLGLLGLGWLGRARQPVR